MIRAATTSQSHPGTSAWALSVTNAQKKRQARPQRTYRGRYVYAWFNEESKLPFYIGRGTGSRAWDRHQDGDGRAMFCQTTRVSTPGFRVEVIRDNLTEEGAALAEACLISFVSQCGGTLTNQVGGMSRQERPPLELDAGLLGHPESDDCPQEPLSDPETQIDTPKN